jgi:phage baseplate assembly protein gpV
MEKHERYENPQMALLTALMGSQSEMWTALPGIIQTYDVDVETGLHLSVSVQPSIQAQLKNPETGEKSWVTLPLLVDCPVFFPAGGGCTLTFPIAKGDECLVVFSSRCIDAWWQSGGIQQQAALRMHDLSDGFAFVGVRSLARPLPAVSTTTVQLRSDDGIAFFELHPTTHAVNINASLVTINGNVQINGNTTHTGQVHMNGKRVDETHTHSDPQGGNTGVVN